MGKIAILGWGSLIWDLENLAPNVRGHWHMDAGPKLPMEFSRISPKRKLGLVVCLDTKVGVDCATHAITSIRQDLPQTIDDLAMRERAPLHRIGAVDSTGYRHSRMPEICGIVADWCDTNGWDGAVWTDLEPNFVDHTQRDFSIAEGIAYLRTLSGENLIEAFNYIENAPVQTQTPLRDALCADAWWQGLKENGKP